MTLVGVGILIIIPKFINIIINTIKINLTVPYLENIINSKIYNIDFLNYSKLLICVGIISLIVLVILKNIVDKVKNKLNSGIRDYIEETEKKNYEISKKNDMEIKIKQEKAKTTNYVRCSNCGSDNILSDKVGRCKFCRSVIENKN